MKPGLKIKQVDKANVNPNEDVIIIAQTGPVIFIKIDQEARCQISGIKLTVQGEETLD